VRSYLQHSGYRYGPLFCAAKNGGAAGLRYQSIQKRWAGFGAEAGVRCSLHQLRHTYATELVNDGVSYSPRCTSGLATNGSRRRYGMPNGDRPLTRAFGHLAAKTAGTLRRDNDCFPRVVVLQCEDGHSYRDGTPAV